MNAGFNPADPRHRELLDEAKREIAARLERVRVTMQDDDFDAMVSEMAHVQVRYAVMYGDTMPGHHRR